jgi:hypothetical protein
VIGRIVLGTAAALALAIFTSGSVVHAKACPKLCKAQIKACKQGCTETPKAACKRECKKHFVAGCKASSDVPKERTCPASPSGAFLD